MRSSCLTAVISFPFRQFRNLCIREDSDGAARAQAVLKEEQAGKARNVELVLIVIGEFGLGEDGDPDLLDVSICPTRSPHGPSFPGHDLDSEENLLTTSIEA